MSELRYPQARRLDLTEDILGYQISDPYRWMEADSAERADWLAQQSELFAAQRQEWPGRDALAGQVRALLGVGYVFGNDTRVDPLHAYKMCAALQHATSSGPGHPVLLRTEDQVGHGPRAVSRMAGLAGDALAFAARYTGLKA